MTGYLSRLAGGRGPDALAPSGRSRSPLSERDQRLDLPGFPEASLGLEPSTGTGWLEQPSGMTPIAPIEPRVIEAGARPIAPGQQVGKERPDAAVLSAPRAGAPDVVRTEAIQAPTVPSVLSPADPVSAAVVRIAESIRRENAHAVVPQTPMKPERTARRASIEPAPEPAFPALRGIEPAPRQKLDEAPLPIASGPVLEIGAIHVEVVRPAPKPSRDLAPPKPRSSTLRAASRSDATRPLRSKLRFGLRQL